MSSACVVLVKCHTVWLDSHSNSAAILKIMGMVAGLVSSVSTWYARCPKMDPRVLHILFLLDL